jgi:hypothetical protein
MTHGAFSRARALQIMILNLILGTIHPPIAWCCS